MNPSQHLEKALVDRRNKLFSLLSEEGYSLPEIQWIFKQEISTQRIFQIINSNRSKTEQNKEKV